MQNANAKYIHIDYEMRALYFVWKNASTAFGVHE